MKGWKSEGRKLYQAIIMKRKLIAMLVLFKIDFTCKCLAKDREGHKRTLEFPAD